MEREIIEEIVGELQNPHTEQLILGLVERLILDAMCHFS